MLYKLDLLSVDVEAEIFAYLTFQILLLAVTPRDGQYI